MMNTQTGLKNPAELSAEGFDFKDALELYKKALPVYLEIQKIAFLYFNQQRYTYR